MSRRAPGDVTAPLSPCHGIGGGEQVPVLPQPRRLDPEPVQPDAHGMQFRDYAPDLLGSRPAAYAPEPHEGLPGQVDPGRVVHIRAPDIVVAGEPLQHIAPWDLPGHVPQQHAVDYGSHLVLDDTQVRAREPHAAERAAVDDRGVAHMILRPDVLDMADLAHVPAHAPYVILLSAPLPQSPAAMMNGEIPVSREDRRYPAADALM